jgi:aminoglycoside phosphotransferase
MPCLGFKGTARTWMPGPDHEGEWRVFPAARSVSVEPASPGRLLVVYRVRADDAVCYLRVAEEAGQDLATDAQVLASLAGLGVRVPEVVRVESDPGDLGRSFLVVAALDGDSLACHGTDAQACHAARRPDVTAP